MMLSSLAAVMESFCYSTSPDVVGDVVRFEHVKVVEFVEALGAKRGKGAWKQPAKNNKLGSTE